MTQTSLRTPFFTSWPQRSVAKIANTGKAGGSVIRLLVLRLETPGPMSNATISIRPTDSDDVKWALQTASTQVDRGSLADAIQWVTRAAQYADEAGDAWRSTELKNLARMVAEQMWTSESSAAGRPSHGPVSIDVPIEDVDADDLLDESPHASPGFQSVPPGVVLRQSYPSMPIPLSKQGGALQAKPMPLHSLPGAWSPSGNPLPSVPPLDSSGSPSMMPTFVPPSSQDMGFGTPAPNGSYPPPPGIFVTKAPTLQFGSPQEREATNQAVNRPPPPRRRSIRPKAPVATRSSSHPPAASRSSFPANGAPGGPDVFSSAPPAERFAALSGNKAQLSPPRLPLGTAPDLPVSELDLELVGSNARSILPPSPSSEELTLTPEEFELHSASSRNGVASGPRSDKFSIDPELADLFAPEEVVEDRDSLDRMSDIVLDPSEFDRPSLADDQEETHVLNKASVSSLHRAASRLLQSGPDESGEHQTISQSGLPTAPPPVDEQGANRPEPAVPSSKPPPFSRQPASSRRVVSISSKPPFAREGGLSSKPPGNTALRGPFRPTPSAPDTSNTSTVPSTANVRSAPPVLVRRGTSGPASAPVDSISSHPPPKPQSTRQQLTGPVVDGVRLEDSRGFEDLPAEVQLALASSARVERLRQGEEVSFFGAAIVTAGTVDILPAFSDESGAIAHEGDVIFTHGNLQDSIDLRVVAKIDDTRVAVWEPETLRHAIAECPWVADELKLIADRYLAVCGATLGPLGEHLDDALRAAVFQRLDVRIYQEGEVLAEANKPVPGLLIVGGGRVLLRDAQNAMTGELNMGDFVFAQGLLGGNKAPFTAVAAKGGTLVLAAPRQVAHELIMSVPPLVEVLAG
jgi:hypothetical protein